MFRSSNFAYIGKKKRAYISAVPLVFSCIPPGSRYGNVPNELILRNQKRLVTCFYIKGMIKVSTD